MSVRPSVDEILRQHVSLELQSIDRMYLNLYVPQLQCARGVVTFFRIHRGHTFASSTLMVSVTRDFVAAIDGFVKGRQIPVVRFVRGQRKDDVALQHLARFQGEEGILFLGIAQEKNAVFRTEKVLCLDRSLHGHGQPVLLLRRGSGLCAHFSRSSVPTPTPAKSL